MQELVKKIFDSLGYEVRRKKRDPESKTYDPFYIKQKLLEKCSHPTIFDVGAYVGDITKLYRRKFPSARIYSFEPTPEIFVKLQENTRSDKFIYTYKLAISENNEISKFHINKFSPTNSLLKSDSRGNYYWGTGILDTAREIDVQSIKLDDFCASYGIDRIDLLKLDIQGAELKALRGAEGLLKNHSIALIYSEVIMMPTYQGQTLFHELAFYLYGLNYELFNIYNRVSNREQLIEIDVIFISKTYKSELTLFAGEDA
jgi:FkbM family methyltransferase